MRLAGERCYNPHMNDLDTRLTRRYGSAITAASVIAACLFLFALARRSYWAVAVPVAIATAASLALTGALGRLLMTTPDEPPDPD